MAEFALVRVEGSHLVPDDPWSEETIRALPKNVALKVEIKADRVPETMKLYWAGLGHLLKTTFSAEDQAMWPTTTHLHRSIMEKLGYVERFYRLDGTYRLEVESIAMNKMSETTFRELFERVKMAVQEVWGVDPWADWIETKKAEKIAAQQIEDHYG
jgi:hypothetical protein